MKHCLIPRPLSALFLAGSLAVLAGCAGNSFIPDTPVGGTSDFGPIQGQVFGGHAPLVGAHVYLLQVAAGGGGLGTSATSLLGTGTSTSPGGFPLAANLCTLGGLCVLGDPNIPAGWEYVTTNGNGSFSLTNGYACTPGLPVYVYAFGGAPSVAVGGSGVANPAIVNLATLGVCPLSGTFLGSPVSYIFLNEVSTVATAYAFQGFTSASNNDAVHIGFSGLNSGAEGLAGIQNAANNTYQLYDINGSGPSNGANSKTYNTAPNNGLGTVPQALLNTLGNILAACVDSGNATYPATNAQCTTLFNTATSNGVPRVMSGGVTTGGVAPTDTATAAINIARHPAGVTNTSFASTLFGIPTGVVPFGPNLSAAPRDFTVGIQFPGTASPVFGSPVSIATDAYGDFYFTTYVTTPNSTSTPPTNGSGYFAAAFPMGTLYASVLNSNYAEGNVTVDSNQNAWSGTVLGVQQNIYEISPSNAYPYYVYHSYNATFTRPVAPVADNSTSSGYVYFPHGPTCATLTGCGGQANNNPTLTMVNSSGVTSTLDNSLLTTSFAPTAFPTHAAIDAAGYDWLTSDTPTSGNTITRVAKNSGVLASTNFPINPSTHGTPPCGSGWIAPEQPAIDRAGNAWIPIYGNAGAGTAIFVINPTGSSCVSHSTEGGNPVGPYGAAVDGASNIWVTNTSGGTANTGSLAELSSTTGSTLSSTNFQPQNQVSGAVVNLLQDPMNVAVDISGDVFVTNFTGNSIVELIGLATPVYGPLGVAAGASEIGQVP